MSQKQYWELDPIPWPCEAAVVGRKPMDILHAGGYLLTLVLKEVE